MAEFIISSKWYSEADGFLVVFDVSSIESFKNLSTWLVEMANTEALSKPTLIIGTKSETWNII